jgi:hypothetical protein
MAFRKKPLLASGKWYAKVSGAAAAFEECGNFSKAELGIEEEVKKMQDYTQPGGGTYASVTRISNISLNMTWHDLNPTNLARVVFGTTSAQVGGTITDEAHVARKGGLCRTAHPMPTSVTVTNSAASVTYTAGTDYEVRPGGIFILSSFTGADGSDIKVDYTYGAYDVIEALKASSVTLEMMFEGINEADQGTAVLIDFWKVKIGGAKNLGLITDDFAALEVEGALEADTSRGSGESAYYKVRMQ